MIRAIKIVRMLRRGGLVVCCALPIAATSALAQGNARVASVKKRAEPMSEFRRIELKVPYGFRANCKKLRGRVDCQLSSLPVDFPEMMVGLRGGNIASVELTKARKKKIGVRFASSDFEDPNRNAGQVTKYLPARIGHRGWLQDAFWSRTWRRPR